MARTNNTKRYSITSGFSESIVKTLGNIPFSTPLGQSIPLNPYNAQGSSATLNPNRDVHITPGIMTIKIKPSLPVAGEASDAVNAAVTNYFRHVRMGQKAYGNYTKADLFLGTVAVSHVYLGLAIGKRNYGLLNYTNFVNRYTPKDIGTALGIDYDNWVKNMAEFVTRWNNTVSRLRGFVLPSAFKYLQELLPYVDGAFLDTDSEFGQIYVFRPNTIWKYDQKDTNYQGGILKPHDLPSGYTVSQYFDWLEEAISALTESEDVATYMGDIENAFNDFYTMAPLEVNYTVSPVYDRSMLNVIHNCNLVGYLHSDKNVVWQEGTLIKYQPEIENFDLYAAGNQLVDFHHSKPSAMEVVESMLLRTTIDPSTVRHDVTNGLTTAKVASCGFFMVTGVDIYTKNKNSLGSASKISIYGGMQLSTINLSPTSLWSYVLQAPLALHDFNFAPIVGICVSTQGDFSDKQPLAQIGNFGNSSLVTTDALFSMHETALLLAFDLMHASTSRS